MAKYERERFAEAAKAYFKEFGLVPLPNEAEEKASVTKTNANTLREKLGEKHPAYAGLTAVGALRDSIARRFIRLSVQPLAPAPRKTSEKPKAEPAQPTQTRAQRRAAAKAAAATPATPEAEPAAATA